MSHNYLAVGRLVLLLFGTGCTSATDGIPPQPMEADASPAGADLAPPPDLALPDLALPDLGTAHCTGRAMMPPGTTTQTIMSGGRARTYLLHMPPTYDAAAPTSLVFAFHGLSDKATDFIKYIDLEREADSRNLIAIVPQGVGIAPSWNAGNCCGESQLFHVDDVGLVRDLLGAARRDFCIDDRRIFAMGFSNGGMFAHRLACELAGTIAAIGPVSGTPMVPECKPDRPISVLHMHGNADPIVGYNGGGTGTFPKVLEVIADWAKRNSCTGASQQTYQKGAVTCQSYRSCAEKSEVELCTVDKGKHTWPGSSDGTPDIKATPEILDFFGRHGR